MRLLQISILVFLLQAGNTFSGSANNWESMHLKGHVAQTIMTVIDHMVDNAVTPPGENAPKIKYKQINRFSPEGFLIESTRMDADGTVQNRTVNEHGENGLRIASTQYKGNDEITSITKYTYDEHGNVLQDSKYDPEGKIIGQTNYERIYDERGYEIQKKLYDMNGKLIHLEGYVNDNDGRRILTVYKDAEGNITGKWDAVYGDNGLRTERTDYASDGTVESKYLNAYDYKQNPVLHVQYNTGSINPNWQTTSYVYDEQDNWIERIQYNFSSTIAASGIEPYREYHREIEYYTEDVAVKSK